MMMGRSGTEIKREGEEMEGSNRKRKEEGNPLEREER